MRGMKTATITFVACLLAAATLSAQQASLDYGYFKAKVEPIFLKKRPGHARCISCHGAGTPLRLQPLDPGATDWTDEESQKNFAVIKRVASAGDKSKLLMHPLDEGAGGDFFHSGGKHFSSQNDPEWLVLKAFVEGATK